MNIRWWGLKSFPQILMLHADINPLKGFHWNVLFFGWYLGLKYFICYDLILTTFELQSERETN